MNRQSCFSVIYHKNNFWSSAFQKCMKRSYIFEFSMYFILAHAQAWKVLLFSWEYQEIKTVLLCSFKTRFWIIRPKKYICVFQVSGWKKLGMVGRNNILFCQKVMSELGRSERNKRRYWLYDQYYNTADRYEVHVNKTLRVRTCFVFIFKKRRDQSRQGSVWFKIKIVVLLYQVHNAV